jgi:hypothetical protein
VIRLGCGNPDANFFTGGQILHGKGIVKGDLTRLLGKGGEGRGKKQKRQQTELTQLPFWSFKNGELWGTTHGRLRGNAVK